MQSLGSSSFFSFFPIQVGQANYIKFLFVQFEKPDFEPFFTSGYKSVPSFNTMESGIKGKGSRSFLGENGSIERPSSHADEYHFLRSAFIIFPGHEYQYIIGLCIFPSGYTKTKELRPLSI